MLLYANYISIKLKGERIGFLKGTRKFLGDKNALSRLECLLYKQTHLSNYIMYIRQLKVIMYSDLKYTLILPQ